MAVYFLDSSAVVKRYVSELGTAWVQGLFDPAGANRLVVASITGPEVVAAIARRGHGGGLPAAAASRMIDRFRIDFVRSFERVHLTATHIEDAMRLAERHHLRGYDAVQLAAGLAFASISSAAGLPTTLVSADLELNTAAVAEGLIVENPNDHP